MTVEQRLQNKIITWLKQKGCVVIKLSAMPGVPSGIPDVLFLLDGGGWGFIEVKSSSKARFQPLQKEWLKKLDGMYWARAVHPDNWAEVKAELENLV